MNFGILTKGIIAATLSGSVFAQTASPPANGVKELECRTTRTVTSPAGPGHQVSYVTKMNARFEKNKVVDVMGPNQQGGSSVLQSTFNICSAKLVPGGAVASKCKIFGDFENGRYAEYAYDEVDSSSGVKFASTLVEAYLSHDGARIESRTSSKNQRDARFNDQIITEVGSCTIK